MSGDIHAGEVTAAEAAALERATELGETVRLLAPPNPWVGCVLLRDGRLVAEGATGRPGEPHAEVAALRAAGDAAREATAVVTLEPCAHTGRTPPCARALVEAGVTRVVVGMSDPDPLVAEQGIAALSDAGVDVVRAPSERVAPIRRSLTPYLHHRRTGRPFVVAKIAQSVDGRIAPGTGAPRWVTGPEARADAHRLRAASQAVMVGAGTALADRPRLTVRDAPAPASPPTRVLVDARGRVPADGALFAVAEAPTLVITTDDAAPEAFDGWRAAGAKVEVVPSGNVGVDLHAALELLGGEGVVQLLAEGGPTLLGSLLDEELVDRLVVYVAPRFLGDEAPPAFRLRSVGADRDWRVVATERLGDDVRIELERGS